MQVGPNAVVTIDYTLKDPQGQVLDSTAGREALPYLHGTGSLIPGLERALEGRRAGEKLQVALKPEDAYGMRDEKLVQKVARSAFQNVPEVKVGMQFQSQGPGGHGARVVTVSAVEGDQVTVDGNHPLAGVPLEFDVTIKSVRAATADEIAHGHVHGPGGHHHH